MYTQHFGLKQDPFSIAPDPRFLFMSERHREALAHLLYGVAGQHGTAGGTGGGFVLLTGDIGAGKTTICRCFLEQIPTGCHVAYIFNPKLTVLELLQSICEEFHIALSPSGAATAPSAKSYIDALNVFLLQSHAAGESCVLIIDEAQNLSGDVLEQLRLLTNLETHERKLLQIVLIGQPELRTLLASPALEQLAQRVVARFHLGTLSAQETAHYIEHRLAVAGHTGAQPFQAKALARIHQLTGGVPRRINLLCGRALLGAWTTGQTSVNVKVVNKAAAEVFGDAENNAPKRSVMPVAIAVAALLFIAALGLFWWLEEFSPNPVLAAASTPGAVPAQTPASLAVAQQALASAPASPPASSPAASPVSGPQTPPAPLHDLSALWPSLPQNLPSAWRELASVWALPALSGEPCEAVAQQQLLCHQVSKLTLVQLRQLGRPGILTLQQGTNPPVYGVLLGLSDATATLRVDGKPVTLGLMALSQLWQGDFATYWKPPSGFTPILKNGASGPVIRQLTDQLNQVEGRPLSDLASSDPVLDAALRQRVAAFQQVSGLKPDGLPGALTFMQLERVLGLTQPRLQTEIR
ncbi:MAG: proteinral secretion pathway protein A [Comamonadaceae bacterium]|nr:MAG: proteinral secretion pathway protein A [Comamonadaceae bacterium]